MMKQPNNTTASGKTAKPVFARTRLVPILPCLKLLRCIVSVVGGSFKGRTVLRRTGEEFVTSGRNVPNVVKCMKSNVGRSMCVTEPDVQTARKKRISIITAISNRMSPKKKTLLVCECMKTMKKTFYQPRTKKTNKQRQQKPNRNQNPSCAW